MLAVYQADAGMLLPERCVVVPEPQVMLWKQPPYPARFMPGVFPVFNMEAAEGRFYGFPIHGDAGFKIGRYHHRFERIANPDAMDRTCGPEDEAVLRESVSRYFPDADGPTLMMKALLQVVARRR